VPTSALDPFFRWLESTTFSLWLVESPSLFAFPGVLAVHTLGLALLAGLNGALDLRLLGVAPGVAPGAFMRLLPVMRLGFWLNVTSGVALVLAYPTKALTNPVFYLKLVLIGVAIAILRAVVQRLSSGEADTPALRRLAALSLLLWASTITAGRLLAYTCSRLTVDLTCQ
jgi:hypothetical protein